MPTPTVDVVILYANIVNKNGNRYSEEMLRNMADGKIYFYDAAKKCLFYKKPVDRDIMKKLKEGLDDGLVHQVGSDSSR